MTAYTRGEVVYCQKRRKMVEKYGNLSFGQVYKLLISIIGQDAALSIAENLHVSIIKKNPEKKYKYPNKKFIDLKRLSEENETSFIHFRPSESTGVMELVRNFFQLLEEEKYGFPKDIGTLVIVSFFGTFRNAIRALTPYEKQTKDILLLLLNWFFGYLGLKWSSSENQEIHSVSKISVKRLLEDTYEIVFDEILKNINMTKDMFYERTKSFYKRKPLNDFEQVIKRDITECYKNNSNIPWKKDWYKFKAILDFINSRGEKEMVHRLIGLYLLKNTETALKEICGIEQKDVYRIKQDVLLWAKEELPSKPQSESQCFLMTAGKYDPSDLSVLQRGFIDPDYNEQILSIQNCWDYLWRKNSIEPDRAEQLIQVMEDKCPNCGIFFGNWARARMAVLSCKFDSREEDKSLRYYHTAFDKGRNFAGTYLKAFLEESIAATVYFNRRRIQDIPEVIYTNKKLRKPKKMLTTPITNYKKEKEDRDDKYGAKQYYEYGYALNIFEQESEETYFLHFHAEEHFWKVFPFHQFTYTEYAEQKRNEDLLKAKGIYNVEGGKERLEKYQERLKQKLANRTKGEINDRIEIQPKHNVQYTRMSLALQKHEIDTVECYLDKFKDVLDYGKINTHGSTALTEALTQYKHNRFFERDKQETGRYKKIIMELIERSPVDSLYAETVTSHISVLEEAINAFDIEIIKAIVEKKGFNIQNLKISADELSPLYYAVQRLYFVNQAISKGYVGSTNGNITWKNLNVPGMFQEDKQRCMENMKSDPDYKRVEQLSTLQYIGDPSAWKQELEEIKEIVKYLIDKTDNVDAFAKGVPNGNLLTVLDLAVQSDFDDICRLLIEKGANPTRIFCKNGIPYESPFIRAVYYKAWKTLEMLLTDFKDNIKTILNERFMEDKHTAAHLLFKVDYGSIQYSVNNENFKHIEHFIPLFRSAGTDFGIPDNSGITVRQILRKYNYGHLITP
jgi:hypothetical protein